jgi:hypothetical protein
MSNNLMFNKIIRKSINGGAPPSYKMLKDICNRQLIIIGIFCLALQACAYTPDTDDSRDLKVGDKVTLNIPLHIKPLFSHINLQDGEIKTKEQIQPFNNNCMLDTSHLGPEQVKAQSYIVNKIGYFEDMYSDAGAVIRYRIEIQLQATNSNDELILSCRVLDDTMQYHVFPVDDIKQVMGDYLSFNP